MTPTASIIETVDTEEVQSQELTTQEQRLLREMQTDAVQQIMRRLQQAKRPT